MTSGIYRIICRKTGMSYIGRSVNIEARFRQHKCDAKRGIATALYDAMREHGVEAFDFDIVVVAKTALRSLEDEYISKFVTAWPHGYNRGSSNGGSSLGAKKREAAMAAKRAADPDFDAEYRRKRSAATKHRSEGYQTKSAEVFRARFASDPEFRARVSLNRSLAGKAAHRPEIINAQIS